MIKKWGGVFLVVIRRVIMKLLIKSLLILFFVGGLISCQSHKQTKTEVTESSMPVVSDPKSVDSTKCKSPRSKMCTREYRPVCATRDTGVRCVTTPCPSTEQVTKSNACTACADEKVTSYTLGACS